MWSIVTCFYVFVGALAVLVLAMAIHSFWNWVVNTREDRHHEHLNPHLRG